MVKDALLQCNMIAFTMPLYHSDNKVIILRQRLRCDTGCSFWILSLKPQREKRSPSQ